MLHAGHATPTGCTQETAQQGGFAAFVHAQLAATGWRIAAEYERHLSALQLRAADRGAVIAAADPLGEVGGTHASVPAAPPSARISGFGLAAPVEAAEKQREKNASALYDDLVGAMAYIDAQPLPGMLGPVASASSQAPAPVIPVIPCESPELLPVSRRSSALREAQGKFLEKPSPKSLKTTLCFTPDAQNCSLKQQEAEPYSLTGEFSARSSLTGRESAFSDRDSERHARNEEITRKMSKTSAPGICKPDANARGSLNSNMFFQVLEKPTQKSGKEAERLSLNGDVVSTLSSVARRTSNSTSSAPDLEMTAPNEMARKMPKASALGICKPDAKARRLVNNSIYFQVLPLWEEMQEDNLLHGLGSNSTRTTRLSSIPSMDDGPLWWFPVIPHSSMRRVTWDLLSGIFIVHDTLVAPLEFMEVSESTVNATFGWLARLFWSFDIPASFLTSFLAPDGSAEMRPAKIALKYASTWLILDVVMVVADWIQVMVDMKRTFAYQVITLFRLLRIVRLLRLQRLMGYIMERTRSERMSLLGNMVKSTGAMIGTMHAMSCVWIGIGLTDSTHWIARYGLERDQHLEQYLLAFHWSLANYAGCMELRPQSLMERMFAICSLLIGFLIASCFVSSFASSMTRLSIITNKNATMFTVLHQYLREHNISAGLARRIQLNAANAIRQQELHVPEKNVELLSIVSEPLRAELDLEIFSPVLTCHPLFDRIQSQAVRILRHICHTCVNSKTLEMGDIVFSRGEVPTSPAVLFITSGKLEYTQDGLNTSILSNHEWVSEPVLWTSWIFHGHLQATTTCEFFVLNGVPFWHLARTGQLTNLNLPAYGASFISRMNSDHALRTEMGSVPLVMQLVHQIYGKRNQRQSLIGDLVNFRATTSMNSMARLSSLTSH